MSNVLAASKLLPRLELEIATFSDKRQPLLSSQQRAFSKCTDLLAGHRSEQTRRSQKHYYGRARARTFLLDILNGGNHELFILCALAIPITDLMRVRPKQAITEIRVWWDTVRCPLGLQDVAAELCRTIPVQDRDPSDNPNIERKLDNRKADHGKDIRGNNHATTSHPSNEGNEVDLRHFPQEVTHDVVTSQSHVAVNLRDLLTFLLQYNIDWPNLVVACPWTGDPLPSIEICTTGLRGRLELSVELTLSLIKVSQSLSLVPHETA